MLSIYKSKATEIVGFFEPVSDLLTGVSAMASGIIEKEIIVISKIGNQIGSLEYIRRQPMRINYAWFSKIRFFLFF